VRPGSHLDTEQPEVTELVFADVPTFPLSTFPFKATTLQTLELLVKTQQGCLLLFYADRHGLGTTSLAASLSAAAGKKALFLEREEDLGTDKVRKDLESMQVRLNPAEHVLVIDEDEELLHLRSKFKNSLPRPWLVNYLRTNRLPIIWVVDDVEEIPNEILSLFDYVLKFTEPVEKTFKWPSSVAAAWHPRLEKYKKSGSGELSRCVAVWEKTLTSDEPQQSQESRLVEILDRRLNIGAPGVKVSSATNTSEVDASLWNTDVPLNAIEDGVGGYLRWKAENPAMAEPYCVLASGVPGSGKSLFLKHLAAVHGLRLKIFHSSDIVRSLVGETEQHIAGIFKDVGEDEVVLLEECDSLLYSRSRSHYRWEVSAINEFLAQLEAFPGLVFCSTNFLGSLDEAVARRFVAKVVFSCLRLDQIPLAWRTYFPDLDFPVHEAGRLLGLCSGDFKIVANKRRWSLGTAGTTEILSDLVRELEAKERFGKTASRKVGFQ